MLIYIVYFQFYFCKELIAILIVVEPVFGFTEGN